MIRTSLIVIFITVSIWAMNAQNNIEIEKAKVSFVFLNNNVSGSIEGFESQSWIDINDLASSQFKGKVAVETINTGNSIRNWSLKRSKYFDVENYPTILFESTSIEESNSVYLIKGNLTIKKTTKEITFTFENNANVLKGTASLYSSDFDIYVKKKRDQNKVAITIELYLEAQ